MREENLEYIIKISGITNNGYEIDRATISTAIYSYMKNLVSGGYLKEVKCEITSKEEGDWRFRI